MTQAKNGSIIATVIICAVLLGGFAYLMMPEVPEVPTAAEIALAVNVPTAAEVAALISVPAAPSVDTTMVDRLCELTDGCEFYESETDYEDLFRHIDYDDDMAEDFHEELADLIGLDWEGFGDEDTEFVVEHFEEKDTQIRAYSEKDKDDHSWTIKVFARVIYHDIDSVDEEVIYVVVTSVLDEGDYDSLSIEEVTRRFEFD